MAFPVVIGPDTVLESSFLGTGYSVELLDLIEKLGAYSSRLPYGTSTTSATIGTGVQTFVVETERLFIAGDLIRAYNSAGNYMEGSLTSYDEVTGSLEMDCTRAVGAGTFAVWNLVPSGTMSVPVPMDRGGSPATSIANLPKVLGILDKNYTTVCESNFFTKFDSALPYPFYSEVDGGTVESEGNSGALITGNYAGIIQLSVPASGAKAFLSYGQKGFLYLGDGGDMDYQARVLPPVGDGVVARFGMMSDTLSNLGDQFSGFGFGFEITYYTLGGYYVISMVVNDGESVYRKYLNYLTEGVIGDYCMRFSASDKTVRMGATMENVRNPYDRTQQYEPYIIDVSKFYARLNSGAALKRAGLLRPFFYAENTGSTTAGRILPVDSFVTTRFLRRG